MTTTVKSSDFANMDNVVVFPELKFVGVGNKDAAFAEVWNMRSNLAGMELIDVHSTADGTRHTFTFREKSKPSVPRQKPIDDIVSQDAGPGKLTFISPVVAEPTKTPSKAEPVKFNEEAEPEKKHPNAANQKRGDV